MMLEPLYQLALFAAGMASGKVIRRLMDHFAPTGWQDDDGFHLGTEPGSVEEMMSDQHDRRDTHA